MAKLFKSIYQHEETLAIVLIAAYFLLALEAVTMLHYISFVYLAFKAARYLLYGCMLLLWVVHICSSANAGNWKEGIQAISLFLVNHLLFAILLVSSFIAFLTSKSLVPFAIVLLLMCAGLTDSRRLLKWIFFSQLAAMIIIIALSKIGVLEDLLYSTYQRGIRHSLGYIFPLELHAHALFLFLMGVYLYQKKYGWIAFFLVSASNYLLYKMSVARTSFGLLEIAALLTLAAVKIKKEWWKKLFSARAWKPVLCWGLILVFIFPFVISLMSNIDIHFWDVIDNALTGRLTLSKAALEGYNLTLFGQQIEWLGSGGPDATFIWLDDYNFVDNSYIKDFLDYGLVIFVYMYLGYYWLLWKNSEDVNPVGVVCILMVLGIGMMEPRLLAIPFNGFLMLLARPVMADNQQTALWFKQEYPVCYEWRSLNKNQKWAAAALCACLAGGVFWYFRNIHIYAQRRSFIKEAYDHRMHYEDILLYNEIPDNADPYIYSELISDGLCETGQYYRLIIENVPIKKLKTFYIPQDIFERIRKLEDMQNEDEYLNMLEGLDMYGEKVLQLD